MTMGRRIGVLLPTMLVLVAAFGAAPDARAGDDRKELKRRIAVFSFEDKTDHSYHWGGRYKDAGEGMADMLTTALVKEGKFTVIERAQLEALLAEQAHGLSGMVTQQTAAKVGSMLGAELAVFGTITEFGYSKSEIGGQKKGFGGFGVGVKSQKATVAVDVRLVDTSTGEIIAAESVNKDDSKKGLKFSNKDLAFGSQSDFDESLVGKATRKAIDKVVELLEKQARNIPWRAKVITFQGGKVFINAGDAGGVNVGDRFVVSRPGEELIDPDTGISLGSMESEIGEIEVSDNMVGGGKASHCKVVSGDGFQKGDIVRPKK